MEFDAFEMSNISDMEYDSTFSAANWLENDDCGRDDDCGV